MANLPSEYDKAKALTNQLSGKALTLGLFSANAINADLAGNDAERDEAHISMRGTLRRVRKLAEELDAELDRISEAHEAEDAA